MIRALPQTRQRCWHIAHIAAHRRIDNEQTVAPVGQ